MWTDKDTNGHQHIFRAHKGKADCFTNQGGIPTIEARLKISDPLKLRNSSKISDMMSLILLFTSGSVRRVQLDQLIFEITYTFQKSLDFK